MDTSLLHLGRKEQEMLSQYSYVGDRWVRAWDTLEEKIGWWLGKRVKDRKRACNVKRMNGYYYYCK